MQSSSDDEKIDTDALEKKLREKALLSMKRKKAERKAERDPYYDNLEACRWKLCSRDIEKQRERERAIYRLLSSL